MSGFSEIKNHDNDTGKQSSFDPDKRVDVKGTEGRLDTGKKAEFDPDKRVETSTDIKKTLSDYVQDVKNNSEYPETIPDKPFSVKEIKHTPSEVTLKLREEFQKMKPELRNQWEKDHNQPWPKYKEDVYINGNLIRKAGMNYDAHHIQPLTLGGKNEVSNITPLHAEVHYDSRGVHAQDSPFGKLTQ